VGLLDGKVAIVTGAASGIGLETALMFAAEGAAVVCVGRRREPLDAVVDKITSRGGKAAACLADLEVPEQVNVIAGFTLSKFGRIDILVNNAGHSSKVRTILHIQPDDWDSVFRVNVEGVYRLTQAVLPDMLKRGDGTVITVSSMAARTPGLLSGPAYGAAKAGVHNLMRGINSELRDKGIRACTILPAEVDTPILNKRPHVPDTKARSTMMQPQDVAQAILLCAAMPSRTLVEEIVMMPTHTRDLSEDLRVARETRP
jgi:NADP-dependent 3-hydroxy acid dehydrogenase YdfG